MFNVRIENWKGLANKYAVLKTTFHHLSQLKYSKFSFFILCFLYFFKKKKKNFQKKLAKIQYLFKIQKLFTLRIVKMECQILPNVSYLSFYVYFYDIFFSGPCFCFISPFFSNGTHYFRLALLDQADFCRRADSFELEHLHQHLEMNAIIN